jgi:DNA replication protein DnaC
MAFPVRLRYCEARAGEQLSCAICNGLGMKIHTLPNGERVAEDCDCRQMDRTATLLRRANIPRRYENCTLDDFQVDDDSDPTLAQAKSTAQSFVREYPVGTEGKGLLFVGNVGLGKTHLAIGILRDLISTKAVRGLFCDYRELLKEIQHSYSPQVLTTELAVLQPVFDAEVLVLDELGAAKATDWIWDTVALILNSRYNDKRTTIITTNFANRPSLGYDGRLNEAARAKREETLGDRIGDRMRSKLAAMCVDVEMRGADFRQDVGRARFG